MSVAGEVSYLRRFAGKFVEIVAAGIGTAVSGYLVAHLTGYLSSSTPATVTAAPPQAISSPAEPRDTGSIETKVRAALTSLDVSRAAPPAAAAMPQPPTPASPAAPALAAASVSPLATTEIKSLPVAAVVYPPLPPEQDAQPSDSAKSPPIVGSTAMLPPQPPPANGDLFSAFKHFPGFSASEFK